MYYEVLQNAFGSKFFWIVGTENKVVQWPFYANVSFLHHLKTSVSSCLSFSGVWKWTIGVKWVMKQFFQLFWIFSKKNKNIAPQYGLIKLHAPEKSHVIMNFFYGRNYYSKDLYGDVLIPFTLVSCIRRTQYACIIPINLLSKIVPCFYIHAIFLARFQNFHLAFCLYITIRVSYSNGPFWFLLDYSVPRFDIISWILVLFYDSPVDFFKSKFCFEFK